MKADSSGQVGAKAEAESEKYGHFLDPFSPIPSAKAARGRIRLAAIVAYFAWIVSLVTLAVLLAQINQEDGAPLMSGARALVPILVALAIVLPIGATLSLFSQTTLTTALLGVALLVWLVVRLYLHINMAVPTGIGIVLAAASVVLTVIVAIAMTHAIRSQLALRERAGAA